VLPVTNRTQVAGKCFAHLILGPDVARLRGCVPSTPQRGGNRGQYEDSVVVRQLPGADCVGCTWTVQQLWVGGRSLDRVAYYYVVNGSPRGFESRSREQIER
jgi:hypothetical protein